MNAEFMQCPTASHFEHIYAHIHTLTSEYYFRRMTEIIERVQIADSQRD